MTNAEAIAQALLHSEDLSGMAGLIACPYTREQEESGCNGTGYCDDCIREWLEQEWEE